MSSPIPQLAQTIKTIRIRIKTKSIITIKWFKRAIIEEWSITRSIETIRRADGVVKERIWIIIWSVKELRGRSGVIELICIRSFGWEGEIFIKFGNEGQRDWEIGIGIVP